MCKTIAVCNQKGGVGKTTTTVNLGVGLAMQGKRVLLVDADPQADLTASLGWQDTDSLDITISDKLSDVIRDRNSEATSGILHHKENVDLLPANLELSAFEMSLVTAMSRETAMRKYLDTVKHNYDYIIIDCPPSLGLLTLNALVAADGVIVPMVCEFYALEGLSQLSVTIRQVKKLYNKNLEIAGILITMYDKRLNLSKSVLAEIRKYYPDQLFKETITRNVRLSEAPSYGMPVMYYDKHSKGAASYEKIAAELMKRM